jgi:hypothetical protein
LRDAQPCSTLDLLASPLHTLLVLAGDPPDTASARAAIARLNRWDHIVHTIRIDDRGGHSRIPIQRAMNDRPPAGDWLTERRQWAARYCGTIEQPICRPAAQNGVTSYAGIDGR